MITNSSTKKLKVLTFNIEYGGSYIYESNDYQNILNTHYSEIIRNHQPDIALFQEPFYPISNNITDLEAYDSKYIYLFNPIENLAKAHNYYYMTTYNQYPITILSKYKINEPIDDILYKININSQIINIIPIHLSDILFTFYTLRNISPYQNNNLQTNDDYINESYKSKKPYIEKIIKIISDPDSNPDSDPNSDNKYIIAGDFNEPSLLDDKEIKWNCSKILLDCGFIDTYRELNKTTTYDKYNYNYAGSTCNKYNQFEPQCRIDYIYSKNLIPIQSYLLDKYDKISDHIPLITEFII
jgi:endonuclease/exonuclease/phosphatase family metal-dependent hydrolase